MNTTNKYVASCEAGLILKRSPDRIRQLARRGRLSTAIKTAAGRLYLRSDVEKLAKELRVKAGSITAPAGAADTP